ncbi:ribose-5-phosphate isomerase RpiA [Halosegnis sp.]|uniref:ribose-5-phosphate isomerase RpiA n=1 Tax=Halosegnis sp. TaxID=2864959 RepID=UPI0035D502D4
MKRTGGSDAAKRRAGEAAADRVTDGQVVGLGTGSTAAHAIRALGRAVDAGLDIAGIPTSAAAREVAREAGVPLTSLADARPDVAIDGADEVAASERGFDLLKGGGAAHAREKYVDAAAAKLLVVADPTKLTETLTGPVTLAVLPEARPVVADRVRALDGKPTLRAAERKDGPVVTDDGNLVLDCSFGPLADPASLEAELSAIPGIVEHGLFVGLADTVFVGHEDGVEVRDGET